MKPSCRPSCALLPQLGMVIERQVEKAIRLTSAPSSRFRRACFWPMTRASLVFPEIAMMDQDGVGAGLDRRFDEGLAYRSRR